MSAQPALILVLGDQLTPGRGALRDARPGIDTVVMAEVRQEATYVRHNKMKIALIFSAMRHFRDELESLGFSVIYYRYEEGKASLLEAAEAALERCGADSLRICEPGEYRLLHEMQGWRLSVPLTLVADDRFLCSRDEFGEWAGDRKQLRMEHFYRVMRKRYQLLLDENDGPEGGKWNYDQSNRKGWRNRDTVPDQPDLRADSIDGEVLELVQQEFADHPGDLDAFQYATDREGARAQLQWFLQNALPLFGTYQDALAEESPHLFHSLVSMYINIGLLDPLEVCRQVEGAFRNGHCDLSDAEGFIRQVLGWREYVRGIYWRFMPAYAECNSLEASHPLPDWFWSGETDMRCLSVALRQSLDLGYAHHIQRLMVIGNFCLLAGIDVAEVCAWYLAVYVDAFEWVELPNTLGMALYGDGGTMASKPYAASGKYIQRQGNHCGPCRYDPKKTTGEGACPYNSLYWHFIDRHAGRLRNNPRMALPLRNWDRKPAGERAAILRWADSRLEGYQGARD
jgi:deoxyribodipyrimidine photolyase-related protein